MYINGAGTLGWENVFQQSDGQGFFSFVEIGSYKSLCSVQNASHTWSYISQKK